MKMIKINEGFTCANKKCGKTVKALEHGTCRNHCPFCLFSMHVDLEVPGDRLSECHGLMAPIGLELNKKKGARVEHLCQLCGFKNFNRTAPDDNLDLICELSRIPRAG
ncbi:MAG: RNHCP domain-containing protein [Candidatus Peregrinibacteria bacterium]